MRIAVTGAAGRMGKTLVEMIHAADDLSLGAALESKNSPALGMDAGELVGAGALGGAIGADLGTVLGEGHINISRMQLALVPERGEAALLFNVDPLPDAGVLEKLRSLPHVVSAQLVDLGP